MRDCWQRTANGLLSTSVTLVAIDSAVIHVRCRTPLGARRSAPQLARLTCASRDGRTPQQSKPPEIEKRVAELEAIDAVRWRHAQSLNTNYETDTRRLRSSWSCVTGVNCGRLCFCRTNPADYTRRVRVLYASGDHGARLAHHGSHSRMNCPCFGRWSRGSLRVSEGAMVIAVVLSRTKATHEHLDGPHLARPARENRQGHGLLARGVRRAILRLS